ncbi:hypothetical protein ABAC402_13550 [Asticcacaulis sp. AC402]|nr:hypothetical protein ABAC402_13550 [Asticcacaulis sp. AC402]
MEFCPARDIQHRLGYAEWRDVQNVIAKVKTTCEVAGQVVHDHFAYVGKMVELSAIRRRDINDIMLKKSV